MSVMHAVPLQVLGWSRIARAPKSGLQARGDKCVYLCQYSIGMMNTSLTCVNPNVRSRHGARDAGKMLLPLDILAQ
jgi:hypothetical protein